MSDSRYTLHDFTRNFLFPTKRDRQSFVLNEIAAAFSSGYKHILLGAPTGFGKSPVAIAAALTLGSSYICTSTKDLQTQYSRDFPYIKVVKGKNNFICTVKEDFIKNVHLRMWIVWVKLHKGMLSYKRRLWTMHD